MLSTGWQSNNIRRMKAKRLDYLLEFLDEYAYDIVMIGVIGTALFAFYIMG